MKNLISLARIAAAAFLLSTLGAPVGAQQAAPAQPAPATSAASAGQITHLSGTLLVRRDDGTAPRLLAPKSVISPGDTLVTQGDTYARVKFHDETEVVLRPNTQFKIENYAYSADEPSKDSLIFGLIKGGMRSISGLLPKRNRDKVEYRTPTATVGIRGTHFGLLMCSSDCAGVPTPTGDTPANGLHVDVASGAVVVTNSGGTQEFAAGQFGFVATTVTAPVTVPPQQGIRVTMPAVIAAAGTAGRSVGASALLVCKP